MSKFSWSDYAGTKDPYILSKEKIKRGAHRMEQYGLNPGVCTQLTPDRAAMEVFEFGKSHGIFLVCEANSSEQAGFLFRKFLKEAVLTYIGVMEQERPPELDLGVNDKW